MINLASLASLGIKGAKVPPLAADKERAVASLASLQACGEYRSHLAGF